MWKMRPTFFEKKVGKETSRKSGSNRREVTLKFDKSNFSLLFVFVLQHFRTQPIQFNLF